jgi:predicted dinucleotide-binding enzyme
MDTLEYLHDSYSLTLAGSDVSQSHLRASVIEANQLSQTELVSLSLSLRERRRRGGRRDVGSSLAQAWPRIFRVGGIACIKAPAEAVKEAEIVVIATPWSATEPAVKSLGSSLAGKIMIDCTNPLGMGTDGLQLVLGFDTSAGELVASWAPGAFVFKTLNTTGAGNMAKPPNIR